MSSEALAPTMAPTLPPRAAVRGGLITPTIWVCAFVITAYFYCLPLGRYSMGGIASDFRVYDFAMAGFFALVGLRAAKRARRVFSQRSRWFYWAAVLLLACWLSLVVTFTTGGIAQQLPSLLRISRFTGYLLLPAFMMAAVRHPVQQRFLLLVLYANIAVQAVLATGQSLHVIPPLWPEYWTRGYWEAGAVPVGTLSPHHKQIGVVMLLGVAISLSYLRTSKSLVTRGVVTALVIMMLLVIVLSGARTAWLGLGVLGLAHVGIHRGGTLPMVVAVLATVGAFIWLAPEPVKDLLESKVANRVFDRLEKRGMEGVAGERTTIYFEDIPEAIAANPQIIVIGAGFANAPTVLMATAAHNNYLHVLIELGAIGLLLYLKFLASVLKTVREAAAKARSRWEKVVARDAWAAFVMVLVTLITGETLWAQYSMFTLSGQIMIYMGIACCSLTWNTPPPSPRPLREAVTAAPEGANP